MRLTSKQVELIKTVINRYFGDDSLLVLFGSRVDDSKKGGDIDLYVECENVSAEQVVDAKLNALVELKLGLGDQKIDLVVNNKKGPVLPIYTIAKSQGIILNS